MCQEVSDVSAVLCQILEEIGWTPESRTMLVPAIDNAAKRHPRCIAANGLLHGVPRDCFVCTDSHLVMMIGSSEDYPLTRFVDLVNNGEPEPVLVAAAPAAKQRGLFDDD